MPIDYEIPDAELQGFSQEAKDVIQKEMERYGKSVIKQSKQIDERHRDMYRVEGKPDITLTIATQAVVELRPRFVTTSRASANAIRISAAVFSLIVGVTHEPATNQGGAFMLLYVVTIALALLFIILSVMRE
jgi:hypothetical protein